VIASPPPPRPELSLNAALLRVGLFAGTLLAIFGALLLSGVEVTPEAIREVGDGWGSLGPPLFVLVAIVLSCLLAPFSALAGAAGLLFGTVTGTLVGLAVVAGASAAQLLIGRAIGRDALRRLLPDRVFRIDDFLERRGFLAVLYVRLVPGLPFVPLNYAAGATRLRALDLAAGTAVGKAPRVFAYAALGGSLGNLSSPEARIAIVVIVVLAALGLVLARGELRGGR